MISKEQIAHDLTLIYLKNRYGLDINGTIDSNVNKEIHGTLQTEHFPAVSEPRYVKVKTGEKNFWGIERKETIQSGNKVDPLFADIVENYDNAYSLFYTLLCERESKTRK